MKEFQNIVAFIHQLYGSNNVPLSVPRFAGNEKKYLCQCIDSTFVSSVGAFVNRFEDDMARFTGAKRAVVCVSGTNALHMALLLTGVDRDCEVITQSLTFIATCNAISYLGAQPVFIDIDRSTLGLNPEAMEKWLIENAEIRNLKCYNKKTGRRIAACVPMHTFGHPIRIDELLEVCQKWHIPMVEDAAESIGSLYHGRHTGTFGIVGAISFNGNKTITTGGGGMLLFNDDELADKAKHLTTQAKLPHPWEFVHDTVGYNYRMPNINAALGCAQLEQIEAFIADKRDIASQYEAFFRDIPGIEFISEPSGCKSNYWLNAILLENEATRNRFLEFSNSNGVMTRPAWHPMHKLPMFSGALRGNLATTEEIASRLVNIPSSVRASDLL